MKIAYIVWGILIVSTLFFSNMLRNIEKELAGKTDPPFNYIEFEIPPNPEFSKKLFTSIHENNMTAKAQESLDKDFYYIFLYVSTAVLGAILLLKKLNINKQWIFILIAILGVVAGVCDHIENGNLEKLLNDWDTAAANGAVERAANFAKIKFAIILPMLGSVLLGWVYVLGKKVFGKKK